MKDKDIKEEVLKEETNKETNEEIKNEEKDETHEHEHKHGRHTCCGKHGHKHNDEEIGKLKAWNRRMEKWISKETSRFSKFY